MNSFKVIDKASGASAMVWPQPDYGPWMIVRIGSLSSTHDSPSSVEHRIKRYFDACRVLKKYCGMRL